MRQVDREKRNSNRNYLLGRTLVLLKSRLAMHALDGDTKPPVPPACEDRALSLHGERLPEGRAKATNLVKWLSVDIRMPRLE